MDVARVQEVVDKLTACEKSRDEALAAYVTPYEIIRQDLLADLGREISGFAIGDVITSKRHPRRVKITHLSAVFIAGSTYYWTAHGIGPHGSEYVFGFPFDNWHLADARPAL